MAALRRRARTAPPHVYFVGSAIFHYLGPSFAVLLFARVSPPGVAWLRIASAGAIFALAATVEGFAAMDPGTRRLVLASAASSR